ncbi:MAG: DUF4340 domain-containing protein [Micropepsaceae bacterium]
MTASAAKSFSQGDARRGRALLWLALAAIAAVALAVAAVLSGRASSSPAAMNEKVFPGLADAAENAATIKIESPTVYVTLNKGADGKWTVADRSNYPANPEGVRALIISLAELDLIERRTADPARHGALELTTGQAGNGHAITITDAGGKVLAALVAGKVQTRAAGTTKGTLFVRRAGEDQTYLARGGIAFPASVGATLDKTLFPFDQAKIAKIVFTPRGMKPYSLSRATPDTENFALDDVPEGKVAAGPAVLQTPAAAIAGLTFDDVIKADAVKMEDATGIAFTTFEGVTLKLNILPGGSDGVFVVMNATAADDAAQGAKDQAAAINARIANWAYKIPAFVVTNLAPSLEQMVQDKPAPEQTPIPDEEEALPGEPEAAEPTP